MITTIRLTTIPFLALLLALFAAAHAAEPLGQTIVAKWEGHEVNDAQVSYYEEPGGNPDPIGKILRGEGDDAYRAALRELARGRAISLLAEAHLAQLARADELTLSSDEKNRVALAELNNTLRGWEQFASTNLKVTDAEVEEEIATLRAQADREAAKTIVRIRMLFRSAEGQDARATLEQLRDRLTGGDITPEEAVRLYSQAPSATDKGLLPQTELAKLPPLTRKAVESLSPGQWSGIIEGSGGLYLIQLVDMQNPAPATGDNLREVARQRVADRKTADFHRRILGPDADGADEQRLAKLKTDYAIQNNLPCPYPAGCIAQLLTNEFLAQRYLDNLGQSKWKTADEAERRVLFQKCQKFFNRFWILERKEFVLRPDAANNRKAHETTPDELERRWRSDLSRMVSGFSDGVYTEPPIPEGWQLKVRTISLEFPAQPTDQTDTPLDRPAWRGNNLFSEGPARVYRKGKPGRETDFLDDDEVTAAQMNQIIPHELGTQHRLATEQRIRTEVQWLPPLER